ncbi:MULTISPECIES: McrB family protein [unclassified Archaeoglobus]|jgi:MoxR-like ATPase|uniref:McrB family protein n=1 Tax=unclassified Archaeoglobus TaxID=2643606 RepID=UPI0025C72755|nr:MULTISPECIES: AAA family ATPase [unclassified Archaeoglobus]
MTDNNIGIFFIGPGDWFLNLKKSFEKYGRTWLQQNTEIKSDDRKKLESVIKSNGYVLGFGYISKSSTRTNDIPRERRGKVLYVFRIDKIESGPERRPPPDGTAPEFDWYDKEQGGCEDERDYRYKTWIRIVDWKDIQPLDPNVFGLEKITRWPSYKIVRVPQFLEEGGSNVLENILSKLKEKHQGDWKNVKGDFEKTIIKIRELIKNRIRQGSSFTDEDAERVLELARNVHTNCRFLLRYIGSVGYDPKSVILNLLNNEYFSKLIDALENEKLEDVKSIAEKIIQSTFNVRYSTLSTWMAIFRPDLFMPIWGYEKENGTLPQALLKRVKEMEKFVRWWEISANEFFDLLQKLRATANKVGISNLFEAAYYLNKYTDDLFYSDQEVKIQKIDRLQRLLELRKQVILYGPPGTGKTWVARNYVKEKTNDDNNFYEFVTFHPSYSYEEFVEGIRPKTDNDGKIYYEVEDGILKQICRRAYNALLDRAEIDRNKRWEKEGVPELTEDEKRRIQSILEAGDYPKFYLIIDEINRGDISRIFGELITLLEADKRLFAENEILVTLPYSKTKFGVPPNLYIIGTMNTADRSIALIDVALRRRFGFVELMPSYMSLLTELKVENVKSEIEAIDKIKSWNIENLRDSPEDIKKLAIKVLYSINERIKKEYDRDHQIGHSYLLKLKECEDKNKTEETLKYIWYHEIIPLLQEYFYDSPEKLERVLNSKFVKVEEGCSEFVEEKEFIEALKAVAKEGSG